MTKLKENWSNDQIKAVWNKGIIVSGYDSTKYRKDIAGAWMIYSLYGKTESDYGWEIDHIRPKSMMGSDFISNLQPLQWQNNRSKGDNYPSFETVVSSSGNKNILQQKRWY
ncbi:MAG: HNH endonuclease signature motif containing protein [Alphaproteobacteria bacterium]